MAADGVEVAIARRKATPCIIVVGSVATGPNVSACTKAETAAARRLPFSTLGRWLQEQMGGNPRERGAIEL
jgi:hypothetical protein